MKYSINDGKVIKNDKNRHIRVIYKFCNIFQTVSSPQRHNRPGQQLHAHLECHLKGEKLCSGVDQIVNLIKDPTLTMAMKKQKSNAFTERRKSPPPGPRGTLTK